MGGQYGSQCKKFWVLEFMEAEVMEMTRCRKMFFSVLGSQALCGHRVASGSYALLHTFISLIKQIT